MTSHPAQVRTEQRQRKQRRAEAEKLVAYFAEHHPAVLAKTRTECLELAHKSGGSPQDVVNNAWRHLVSRLRFLSSEGSKS